MLFDTHAHVNFSAFKDDRDEVIKRSLENETWLINVGSQYSTSQRAVKIAQEYSQGVYAAIGLHPIHLSGGSYHDPEEDIKFATQAENFNKENYFQLAKDQKVVAIGETGLDYYRIKKDDSAVKKIQAEVFKQQIELACELDLPLIIHCRDAHNEIIKILGEEKKKFREKLRGVIHCFSGKLSQAKGYLELGFLLGFTGIITFAQDYDRVVREIDLDNFLIETDCPYLAPVSYRGQRNEPLYVRYVAEKIAEIKGLDFAKVAQITSQNARRLFKI